MLKFGDMTTTIRIQTKTVSISESGFSTEGWADLIDDDLPCEWRNKYGVESWRQEYVHAREPASVRMWYISGVDATCRVVRDDGAVFDIVNVDDVENRHMQLELEVRRFTGG
jgi:head-tail adaptor